MTEIPKYDDAHIVAELAKQFIDTLVAEGWPVGAVMAGSHAAVMARIATNIGPEFAAYASEKAAAEMRGGMHG